MAGSEMIAVPHTSTSLEGNFLGDPVDRQIYVYLPAAYTESTTSRFPVVYYLTGYASRGASMMNQIPWGETIQEQMDRLINTGKCEPMIMVLPDSFTRLGGSQYINSSGTGQYEDYMLEIVELIDRSFRTKTDSRFRAAAGKSSGGFGALYLGMHHPDIFGSVIDHSGDKFFEACYYPDFLRLPNLLAAHDLQALISDPYSYPKKHSGFFQLINLAAMASCYSPDPSTPEGFNWPVDAHTGELNQDVWNRWKSHDPVDQFPAYKNNLDSLHLLYFDCGSSDEYNLHLGSRLLHSRLDEAGISHIYEEFDGTHRHTRFRLDTHMSRISGVFSSH